MIDLSIILVTEKILIKQSNNLVQQSNLYYNRAHFLPIARLFFPVYSWRTMKVHKVQRNKRVNFTTPENMLALMLNIFTACCFSRRNVRLYAVRYALPQVMVIRASEHVVPHEHSGKRGARQNKTSVAVL